MASMGSRFSKSTAWTAPVMGMSTRYFCANYMTLRAVATPSTT